MIFKPKTVILASHVFTTVPLDSLIEYFCNLGVSYIKVISHPLFPKKTKYTTIEIFKNTQQKAHKTITYPVLPVPVSYIYDVLFIIVHTIFSPKIDLYIGLNSLSVLAGLFLRLIGKVSKVVYYTIDFVPQRFSSSLLNQIYHAIDAFAVEKADITWNVSPRIKEGREEYQGMISAKYQRQIVVPIGIWTSRVKMLQISSINRYGLVYAGGLSKHQGLQHLLKALPKIKKKFPKVHLTIIGQGDYKNELKKQVGRYHIESCVTFAGYQNTHQQVEDIVKKNAIGIALYDAKYSLWSQFADPSKIKTYLVCSCPVLTTNLTHLATDISSQKAGVVVELTTDEIVDGITRMLQKENLQSFRVQARQMSLQYDWQSILNSALDQTYL